MGESLADEMAKVRKLTDKPFGVDLLTALPGQVDAGIQAVIDGGARDLRRRPRRAARRHRPPATRRTCSSAACAARSATPRAPWPAAVDFVVAQGTEAGGHTGFVATMALVPQVVDAVGDQVPVVAAGGLFDGRGLAACLALGADGVWIGTRFIATPEAQAVNGYKDALLALHEDGTVISESFTGKTCRVVRNDWTNYYEQHPDELQPFPPAGRSPRSQAGVNHLGAPNGTEVEVAKEFMPAGQGAGAIHELVPAGDLVRSIVAEAERTIDRLLAVKA